MNTIDKLLAILEAMEAIAPKDDTREDILQAIARHKVELEQINRRIEERARRERARRGILDPK